MRVFFEFKIKWWGMIKLHSANFLGIHSLEEATNIKFNKRMTILTGFNGTGKSSMLLGLFLTLDGLNERKGRNFLTPRKNWGVEINLTDDPVDIEGLRNSDNQILPKKQLNLKFRNVFLEKQDIETMRQVSNMSSELMEENFSIHFNEIMKTCNKKNESTLTDENSFSYSFNVSDRTEDNTEFFSFQVGMNSPDYKDYINNYGNKIRTNNDRFSATLYQDEQFFDTRNLQNISNIEGIDIFAKNNNLDKSIYILLSEFRKKILAAKSHLPEILSENIFNNKEIFKYKNKNELNLYFENLITNEKYNKEIQDFLKKVNNFFLEINKELFISEVGDLYFKEYLGSKRKIKFVKWYNCSKGEKNLLSLLLMVFIYKDSNTVFLMDEPDLSLHVNWQKKLVEVLLEIAPKSQFILSTHSPALIPKNTSEIHFENITKLKEEVENRNE